MGFKNYFEELKRRKVFKAAVAYLAVAWVIVEVASAVLPAFDTPPVVLKALIILVALGFPVNLIFSWVYDVTPEGLKKTDELPATKTHSQIKGRRLNRVIIGFLSLAVVLLLYNQFWPTEAEVVVQAKNPGLISDTTIKTIAVLPFEDNSSEGDHKWLTTGVVEAINNNLWSIEGLRVIASPSVDQLVNDSIPANQIANVLKLTHFLIGSVLRIDDNIRINVQLISTDDNSQVWAKAYDQEMEMGSYYDIIDEVANSVSRELNLELNTTEIRLPDAERTSNPTAYEFFLRSRYLRGRVWGKSPPVAREYLEKAIQLDSTFYAAYADLGFYWVTQQTWNGDRSSDYQNNIQKSNELFEFAIEHAPSHGSTYVYYALNNIWFEQKFEAYQSALKGYRLNPSTFNKLLLVNTCMSALGDDPEQAYDLALEAMKESPLESGAWTGKAITAYFVGKHEEAVNTINEGLRKFPEGNIHDNASRVLYWAGDFEKVVDLLEEYFLIFPDRRPARILGFLAAAHYQLGNLPQYESLMEELRQQAATSPIGSPSFHLALVSAQTGDHEAAFQWLEKAIEDKEVELYWLKVEPPFQPLYDDPRWEVLLDGLGFNDIPQV